MSSPTNLPLTTIFTPAPGCLDDTYVFSYTSGQSPDVLDVASTSDCLQCYDGLQGGSCLPSGWNPSRVFSPGICPHGYFTACFSVTYSTIVTRSSGVFETVATCCPSGFTCRTAFSYGWQSTEPCGKSVDLFNPHSFTFLSRGTTKATVAVQGFIEGAINAFSIQVRWQSTDSTILKIPTTSPSIPTITSSSPYTPTNATHGYVTTVSAGSLPKGAKIGIGVSIPIIVLAILSAILFLRRRWSRDRGRLDHSTAGPAVSEQPFSSELDAGVYMVPHNQPGSHGNFVQSEPLELDVPSSGDAAGPMSDPALPPNFPRVTMESADSDVISAADPVGDGRGPMHRDGDDDAKHIVAMKKELEKVKAERQRLEKLQELSEKEEKLQKIISEKESRGRES